MSFTALQNRFVLYELIAIAQLYILSFRLNIMKLLRGISSEKYLTDSQLCLLYNTKENKMLSYRRDTALQGAL